MKLNWGEKSIHVAKLFTSKQGQSFAKVFNPVAIRSCLIRWVMLICEQLKWHRIYRINIHAYGRPQRLLENIPIRKTHQGDRGANNKSRTKLSIRNV